MRKNKGRGIFIIIVMIAILSGAAVYRFLPANLEQWRQLVTFGTVIAVTFLLQIIRILWKK